MEKELQVSRNTVDRAYQQLLAEGYIRSVPGAGYFVEDIENDYFKEIKLVKNQKHNTTEKILKKKPVKYDFEYASIDSDLFPWSKWKNYIKNSIITESNRRALSYESSKGNLLLRESLCGFLNRHRGVNCKPEQIIICGGTQYAMEILTNLLPANENRIAYEEPGFVAMRHLFEEKGYNITSIPVLENGIDVELLSKTNCNLLYITPSHQFPTGAVMSISNRNKILKWAYLNNGYIIENDYDSEFRYGTMPIPSLQSLDKYQKVIYTGTVSKVLSPSTRCAYMVLPENLINIYNIKYQYFNSALPSYHQLALGEFIKDGLLEKHLRKVSTINQKKYILFMEAIKEFLLNKVEIIKHPAGVHTLVRIINCSNQEGMIKKMEDASIRIYGIKEHWHNQKNAKEDIFLMGFNSMSEKDIRNGCKKMAQVLNEVSCTNKINGKVLIHTVQGDIHDIGKNIVKDMFIKNNFEVYDLGSDVPVEIVIEKAKEYKVDFIIGSTFMDTAKSAQREIINLLKKEGIRDNFIVMYGGAAVSKEWCDSIEADGYTDTAIEAVKLAKELLSKKRVFSFNIIK
jgi:GntR family transcriptional regulator/MocR family aminotransferase